MAWVGKSRHLLLLAGAGLSLLMAQAALADPAVNPASVELDLDPGESAEVEKTVTTPEIPQRPDIYFLADTTGSMSGSIANVQANAVAILAALDAATVDPRYGAGDYKDFPFDVYAFNNPAPIPALDDDGAAALGAIAGWAASGGGDGPEGWFYALHRIAAHPDAAFRAGATPIVVIFGDAPAHDPVCTAISGDAHAVSEASLTAELVAAGVHVVAVSVNTGGYGAGLDDNPGMFGGSYVGACGAEGGSPGQASRIAAATGGVALLAPTPGDVADFILAGLGNLPVEVTWSATCDDPSATVSLSPASQIVTSGDDASFTETVSLAADAPQGTTISCEVEFFFDGDPLDPPLVETITIDVNDVTPPVGRCVETTNPSGQNVPKSGPNAGKSGQNPDGFYQLLATDNVGIASIVVADGGSSFVSNPFASGDKVKITQAPGVTPSDTRPGPGGLVSHLKLKGDAFLIVTDTSGNSVRVACLVPPPPK